MDYNLSINNLPDSVFIPGKLVRNVARVRVLTRAEKKSKLFKHGGPDIQVIYINGDRCLTTRQEIASGKAKMADGSEIKFNSIKSGREYTIVIDTNQTVGILRVPKTSKVKFVINKKASDGSLKTIELKPGQLVVCPKTSRTLMLNKSAPLVLNDIMFNKMCVFALKDGEDIDTVKKQKKQELAKVIASKSSNEPKKPKLNIVQQNAEAPYRAIGRIVKAGTFNNVIGYIITDGKNSKACNLNTVQKLCFNHKIKNMTLVRKEDGKFYLRGVGIQLDTLDTTYR